MKLTQPKLFEIIWNLSDKKSFISGLPLINHYGTKYHYNMFAHVLSKSKSKYPFFELYFDNIQLLTPKEHFIIDQGSNDNRILYSKHVEQQYNGKYKVDWQKWEDKEAGLLELYRKLFSYKKDGIFWKYTQQEVDEIIIGLNKNFF